VEAKRHALLLLLEIVALPVGSAVPGKLTVELVARLLMVHAKILSLGLASMAYVAVLRISPVGAVSLANAVRGMAIVVVRALIAMLGKVANVLLVPASRERDVVAGLLKDCHEQEG